MADVKISALPLATTPLAGTEVLPIVQSATTDQVSVANLTAGRAVSAASLTLTTPLSAVNGGTGITSLGTGVATALGNAVNGASGIVVEDSNSNVSIANTLVMGSSFKRNRIINGNMAIDQRNAGTSITPTNGQFSVDRWRAAITQSSKFTTQQNAGSVTPPVGFSNYLGITSSSAYSISSGDVFAILQPIEGFNFADFNWGTANAKTITLSAWVYSSLTGTFGGSLQNSDTNRAYPFSYSIPVANTWTKISIVIPGDTTGTWVGATTGVGVYVSFSFGVGSTYSGTANAWAAANLYAPTGAVSVVGTNGATFYITGVQLEEGSVATPYERQIYSDQLAQCQRYLPYFSNTSSSTNTYLGVGPGASATAAYPMIPFLVQTRVAPTGITSSGTFTMVTGSTSVTLSSIAFNTADRSAGLITATAASGLTNGFSYLLMFPVGSYIYFTGCEL